MLYMKYSLAIFDLDGTLLSTLEDIADSCNEILLRNNFPTRTYEEIKSFVGNGIPKLIERALPENTDSTTHKKITQEFIEYYRSHSAIKTAPYPGIKDFLTELKKAGIKIAVNSNKHEGASIDLCNKFFPDLIDAVAGGKPDVPHKPDPSGVNKILSTLAIPRDKVVYIGDSDVDVQTGANAGIAEIAVTWGFRSEEFLKEHGAKNLAHNTAELNEFFK